MEVQQKQVPVTIGYYPFRAKAQVLRLMCEYLQIPYSNLFLNPDQWGKFKEREAKRWIVRDLPFLSHGDFVVTGNHAMITYVIDLAGRSDLLGQTIEHQLKIDSYRSKGDLKDTILGFLVNMRPTKSQQNFDRRKQLNELYERKISKQMQQHQRECLADNYYFGYLTYLDFAIYEIVNYFRLLFPQEMVKFPKLTQIRDRVLTIPQINNYENSPYAVSQFCPIRYFKRFKEEKMRTTRELSTASTQNNNSRSQQISNN